MVCNYDCNWNSTHLSDQFLFFRLFILQRKLIPCCADNIVCSIIHSFSKAFHQTIVKFSDIIYLILICVRVCVRYHGTNHPFIHPFNSFYKNIFRWNQLNYPHAIASSKTSSIKRSWLVKFLILVNWHQCEYSVLRDCVHEVPSHQKPIHYGFNRLRCVCNYVLCM